MARMQKVDFGSLHDGSDARQLAAVLLTDGTFDRVDTWTPVDEVIAEEPLELDLEREHLVLVPVAEYDLMIGAVEWCEQHGGTGKMAIDDAKHVRVPVGSTVQDPEALAALIRKAKLNTFLALMRYVWFNSSSLWGAMRNLLAITHKIAPQFIKGMSGNDIGRLLGVCRAAFNKTEIKLVVEYLERWGVVGGTAGGSKPADHRKLKSEQMMGRRHRAADYESDKEPELKMTAEQRERVQKARADAERRRLADLCGVKPEEIKLDLTNPNPKPIKS